MDDRSSSATWRRPIPSQVGTLDPVDDLPSETALDDVRMPTRPKNWPRRAGFRTVGDVRHAPDAELRQSFPGAGAGVSRVPQADCGKRRRPFVQDANATVFS